MHGTIDETFARSALKSEPGVRALKHLLGTTIVQVPVEDPRDYIDPSLVGHVVVRLGKRELFRGPVTHETGEQIAKLMEHGRKLRVSCKMKDGTTQIYRGNGARIR